MRSVEQSLLRTGLSAIDILLIHDCDVWTHGAEAGRRFKGAMDGAYRALDKLRSEKTVAAIGFGINEADTCGGGSARDHGAGAQDRGECG